MPTIYDVARKAGVSAATVSLVINNSPKVRAATRDRILRIMRQLNYKPNIVARSLRKKQTHTLGLLIESITNPFFPEVARGVEERARAKGFNIIICNTESDAQLEREYIETLLSKQIDGFILCSVKNVDFFKKLLTANYPVVLANEKLPNVNLDFVGIDNRTAAIKGVNHLIKLGHRKIGFIGDELTSFGGFERYKGYKEALLQAGISYRKKFVQKRKSLTYEEGLKATENLLNMEDPPTAIFCICDMMAIGAIDACVRRGIRIPEDMAIVGFDDIWISSLENIQLTTVHQPRYQMGTEAVDLLIERISERKKEPKQLILPTQLIIRKTCGARL